MVEHIEIEEFLKINENNTPIIDVRSPKEFEHGHIPGAFNLPIFSNEERALVGTCYKREGREPAILLGLKLVGPKLEEFAQKAIKLAQNNSLAIHCWRGGMRSSSMAWLLGTVGIKTCVLKGGYKAYRRFMRRQFSKSVKLIVLGGMTGSGKTEILKELAGMGHQVVDLEGLADHKGSAFGGIGQKDQETTEQFENNLYEIWKTFDFDKPIWVEDESKNIGRVGVPDELYHQIRSSIVLCIEIPVEERVDYLLTEYGKFPLEDLKTGITKIKKRLGGKSFKLAIESIENNDIKTATEIALRYYDKAYIYGLSNRNKEMVYFMKCDDLNHKLNAEKIAEFYQNIIS